MQQTAARRLPPPASAGTGAAVTERGDFPAQGEHGRAPSAGAAAARARSPAWPPPRRRSSSPLDRRRRSHRRRRPARRAHGPQGLP